MEPKDQPKPEAPEAPEAKDEQAPAEEAEEAEEDNASVLFFGGHLKDIVKDDLETKEAPAEEPSLDSPSKLFFGETLEETAEREGLDLQTADEAESKEESES